MNRLALAATFTASLAALAVAAPISGALADDAAKIQAGNVDCPHCQLQHAELTNTCAKHGNFAWADFSGAQASLMCMSYADLRGVNFGGTDLSGANLSFAKLDGADFTDAQMTATLLKGTDLRNVKGLTQDQIGAACSDDATKLPSGLSAHRC